MNSNNYNSTTFQNPPSNNFGQLQANMPQNNYPQQDQNQYFNNNAYQPVPYSDVEAGNQSIKNDYEVTMRLGFIRKVYGILSAQLIITMLMCVVSMLSKGFAKFQQENFSIIILSVFTTVVIMLFLLCFPNLLKTSPTNYILLLIFTFCEAYAVSAICSMTNPNVVFMAAAMTVGITLMLTYYACTTKEDFTVCGSLFFIFISITCLFSIFLLFTRNNVLHIIMCCVGVLIYSMYLIYDTQLLLGNKRCSLDYDDYILGALMLYVDVIQLFLNLLEILRYLNSNE